MIFIWTSGRSQTRRVPPPPRHQGGNERNIVLPRPLVFSLLFSFRETIHQAVVACLPACLPTCYVSFTLPCDTSGILGPNTGSTKPIHGRCQGVNSPNFLSLFCLSQHSVLQWGSYLPFPLWGGRANTQRPSSAAFPWGVSNCLPTLSLLFLRATFQDQSSGKVGSSFACVTTRANQQDVILKNPLEHRIVFIHFVSSE